MLIILFARSAISENNAFCASVSFSMADNDGRPSSSGEIDFFSPSPSATTTPSTSSSIPVKPSSQVFKNGRPVVPIASVNNSRKSMATKTNNNNNNNVPILEAPKVTSEFLERELSNLDLARQFREPLDKDRNNPIKKRMIDKQAAIRAAAALRTQNEERDNFNSLIKTAVTLLFSSLAIGGVIFLIFSFFTSSSSATPSSPSVAPSPTFSSS